MKLISCNIQNFGTLSGFKKDFSDGLTVIKEENGFGKTTLALFLKAMFYGLPQTTKKRVEENDRVRLTPWQGGAFGGTLDFETNKKLYRIERFFAEKEKNDTFKLYDLKTGNLSNDFDRNIGVQMFGIDAESFERSVFVPQSSVESGLNTNLNAKLTGLVENSDDLSNYDSAVKSIEKRMKEYSVAGGARGLIAEKTKEAQDLSLRLKDAEAAAENLKRVNSELATFKNDFARLTDEQKKVRVSITAASDFAARQEQEKRRAEIEESIKTSSEQLKKIVCRYPQGMPSDESFAEAGENEEFYKTVSAQLEMLKSDTTEGAELEQLELLFGENLTSNDEISARKTDLKRLNELKLKADILRPQAEALPQKSQSKGLNTKYLMIAAISVLVGGAVLSIFKTVFGIAVMLVGILCIGAAAFIYLKNIILNSPSALDNTTLKDELAGIETEAENLTATVKDFAEKFFPDEELNTALEKIDGGFKRYLRLKASVAERNRKIAERENSLTECSEALEDFYKIYGQYSSQNVDRLAQIGHDRKEKSRLEAEIKSFTERLSELPEVKDLPEKDIEFNREELLKTEEQIAQQLDILQGEITRKQAEANRLTSACEQMPQLEEQLENVLCERTELSERYEVLDKTVNLLAKAKEDLSLRYLDRVKSGFEHYCEVLNGQNVDTMVNTDLNFRVQQQGAAREKGYFSVGIQDMMSIAMRLALSDALFENEAPMLILDDPFVNLDDSRLKKALELLDLLANHRQIIYLTCHSSRTGE